MTTNFFQGARLKKKLGRIYWVDFKGNHWNKLSGYRLNGCSFLLFFKTFEIFLSVWWNFSKLAWRSLSVKILSNERKYHDVLCVVWTNQFDNYYRCHQNHKSIQRVLEQHIKSFIPFITGPLWGQNHFICAFEFWNSDNLKKSLLAVLFRQIWIHWKELMNISSHFGNFYLIQLIDQPILRIQSFKFPNLRCCIVFLFFCV